MVNTHTHTQQLLLGTSWFLFVWPMGEIQVVCVCVALDHYVAPIPFDLPLMIYHESVTFKI